jgi:hypothetical protein
MPQMPRQKRPRKPILLALRLSHVPTKQDTVHQMQNHSALNEILWKLRLQTQEIETKRNREIVCDYASFSPQLPQNFVPAAFFVLHLGQLTSLAAIGFPHSPQNFKFAGTSALQCGHVAFAGGAKLPPQPPQNLTFTGFLAPQLGHTTSC